MNLDFYHLVTLATLNLRKIKKTIYNEVQKNSIKT